MERRFVRRELRAVGDGEQRKIMGYGAIFNSLSEDLGGFREIVLPGAFTDAIETDDVRALFNHDPSLILGRNLAGTLRLAEDDLGLTYEIDPPDTEYARGLMISLERGDVDQSSFAFDAVEESWRSPDEKNLLPTRILHRVRLYDVSPVTYPAYAATTVSARALDQAREFTASPGDEAAQARTAVGRRQLKRYKLNLINLLKRNPKEIYSD